MSQAVCEWPFLTDSRPMLRRLALFIALLLAPTSVSAQATTNVVIATELGDIVVALETERAPVTTANFLRYADEKRFDGIVFYRVMKLEWGEQPNGLVQAGTQWDPERILPPIAHEPTDLTGVKHVAGAISMARGEPGTANGDWSITLSPLVGLDADPQSEDPELRAGYAAFGHVVEGMDVVRKIFEAPLDPDKGEGPMKGELIAEPVEILSVRRQTPE